MCILEVAFCDLFAHFPWHKNIILIRKASISVYLRGFKLQDVQNGARVSKFSNLKKQVQKFHLNLHSLMLMSSCKLFHWYPKYHIALFYF